MSQERKTIPSSTATTIAATTGTHSFEEAPEEMSRRIGSIAVKFKSMVDAGKRAIQITSRETARTTQNAARIFKIMIFRHSAKDFPSVLRLYGMEDSSGN